MTIGNARVGASSVELGRPERNARPRPALRAACLLGSALTASLVGWGAAYGSAFYAPSAAPLLGSITFNRLDPLGPGTEIITANTPAATALWTMSLVPDDPYVFLPLGNTATFQGSPGNGNFSMLNRLLGNSEAIQFNGTIISRISSANTAAGGTVAFSTFNNNQMIFASSFVFDGNRLRLEKDEGSAAPDNTRVDWSGNFTTRAGGGGLYLKGVNFFASAGSITKGPEALATTFLDLEDSFFSLGGATLGLDSVQLSDSVFAFNSLSAAPARTLTQDFTLAGSYGSFYVGANRTLTLAGNISGSSATVALVKDDQGTLVLSGNNSYFGPTYVYNGTLRIASNTAMFLTSALNLSFAPATVEIAANAGTGELSGVAGTTLNLISGSLVTGGANTSSTFAGAVTGAGGLYKVGVGTLTLSGNNNAYSGLLFIQTGAVSAQGGNAIGDTSAVNIGASGTLNIINTAETIGSLTGSGTLNFSLTTLTVGAANTSSNFSGQLTGPFGVLNKVGIGTLTLSGLTSYLGASIQGGTLRVENGTQAAGGGASVSVASGATLEFGAGSGTQNGALFINGTGVNGGGAGALRNVAGATTLSGAITLNGDSSITSAFAAQLTLNGNVTGNNHALTLGGPGLMTVTSDLSGVTSLTKEGTGTVNLSGDNRSTPAIVVNAGILNLASALATSGTTALTINSGGRVGVTAFAAATIGSLAGAGDFSISSPAFSLTLGGNNASTTFSGVLAGIAGTFINKIGTGTLTLGGSNTTSGNFLGTMNVLTGRLVIDGNFGDTVNKTAQLNVFDASLGGAGTFFGNVAFSGGRLAAGDSPGTLTIAGNLALSAVTNLDFELGEAGVVGGANNDLVIVGGNLTLDGTLNTIAAGAGYGPGYYRLFNYGGTLTDNGLNIGTISGGYAASVLTNIAGQVNLLLGTQNVLYWDGTDMTGASTATTGNGGAGVWNSANTNWTAPAGYAINAPWNAQVGVFAGAAGGTVTVQGTQVFQELRFETNGYTLSPADGSARLGTTGGFSLVDVGTGITANIGTIIQGAGGLTKTGAGNLILTGANTYGGTTTIAGGTLTGDTVSLHGNITNAASLVFNQASAGTFAGLITGNGSVTKTGAGNLTLTGTNTYLGGTTVAAGTLTGNTLSLQGNILNNAALVFDQAAGGTYNGVISGTGSLLKLGAGNLTLTGANTYSGGTTIAGGILFGTTTSLQGNFVSNGGLVFNQATNGTFSGAISGTSTVAKMGTGEVTFSGVNTYTGRTSILQGTLTVTGGAALSDVGQVSVISGATFNVAASEAIGSLDGTGGSFVTLAGATLTAGGDNTSTTYAGKISGTGNLTKIGTGTFTLSDFNTFTGTTTVNAGVLAVTSSGALSGAVVNNASLQNAGLLNGGVTNAGTLTSTGIISGGFTNSGSASIKGLLIGAVNNLAGTITFTGDVFGIGLVTQSAGATIDLGAFTGVFGGLAGDGSVKGTNSLIVGDLNIDTTYAGTLSGSGLLLKVGTGSLTLTGATTIAGGISVAAGTLRITATGSNTGQAENSATFINDGAIGGNVFNYAGGSFNNAGTIGGAVTNYNGAAFANSGTISGIAYNEAGAILTNTGTAAGGVNNAGTFTSTGIINTGFVNTGTASLRGQLNGFIVNNPGAITLTGTLTGVTSLNQVAGSSFNMAGFSFTVGDLSGAGTIATGGTAATALTVNGGTITVFSGVISGAGSLVKSGTGVLILTGANTYAGGTTVSNGAVLQIGNAGTTGSIAGAVTVTGTGLLAINRTDAVTLSNVISGTGIFAQTGTGTTTLTGLNTYTGGTVVTAGRLRGDILSLRGDILINGGVAEFAQATAGIYSGRLGGAGALEKTGAGLLTFTGDNSNFTGATRLLAGELRVNSSLARSTVTAASGTTLSGTGTLGGLVAQSGSTVAPGSDGVGMLTVAGNMQFLAGSIYAAQIQASAADLLGATGTAQLAGTLALTPVSGPYLFNSTYTVLQANGGRSGTFGTVTGLGGFGQAFAAQVVYTATGVQVLLTPNQLLTIVGTGAGTANERSTLGRIDAAVLAGYNPQPLAALYSLTPAAMLSAADQLSGEIYATTTAVALENDRLLREAVIGRLITAEGEGYGMWGQAFGSWGSGDSDGNAAAYDRDFSGFIGGVDFAGRSDGLAWRVGITGHYGTSDVDIDTLGSSSEIERTGIGLYLGLAEDNLSLRVGGSYSALSLDANRTIAFTGFSDRVTATTDGDALQVFADIGYRFEIGAATSLEPFIQLNAARVSFDAFGEQGGAAKLRVGEQENTLLTATFGLRGETVVELGGGTTLRLGGTLAARTLSGDRSIVLPIALDAAPNQALAIRAAELDSTAFVGALDATFDIGEASSVTIGYSGLFSGGIDDHAARLTASFRF
ncbi:hypothetical protein sos41_07200 [Alphaproteobacteria bacterium SO-S41]|nr:hypothetical protein sos41_07200 [Alphaproteobacteria bacterium SO-S41]